MSVGSDPDYRFTLANERTFLAWLRTGLALVAGGVALGSVVPELGPRTLRTVLALLLLVLALIVTAGSYVRWERAERALRENRMTRKAGLPATGCSMLVPSPSEPPWPGSAPACPRSRWGRCSGTSVRSSPRCLSCLGCCS
jgi:putative membrane protein